jgi:hypothetical protein
MIPLIMFLAGFYLGVLFYALLAMGASRKVTGPAHLGRQQRTGKRATGRNCGNSRELGSRAGQRP